MSKRKYRRNASTYNNSREAKIDKTKDRDQETLNKEKYQFPMREDRADGQGDLTSIVRLYSGSPTLFKRYRICISAFQFPIRGRIATLGLQVQLHEECVPRSQQVNF